MALNLDAFRNIAKSAFITSRDIAIQGSGENATAKLGNYVFSAGKTANSAVMAAFKPALDNEYGAPGTHARRFAKTASSVNSTASSTSTPR